MYINLEDYVSHQSGTDNIPFLVGSGNMQSESRAERVQIQKVAACAGSAAIARQAEWNRDFA
jgi:hypothetical protein